MSFPNYNLLGLYSINLRNPYYQGPIVRIVRQSDTSYLDFYGDKTGYLTNTGNTGTQSNIFNWLSGTTGKVIVWYDQSGNGNNLTQTNTASQPSYSLSGIYFSGSNTGFSFNTPVQNCYTVATNLYTYSNVGQTILSPSLATSNIGYRFANSNIYGLAFTNTSNYSGDFLAPYNSYYYINNLKGTIGGTLQSDGRGTGTIGQNGVYTDNTWNYFVATRDRDLSTSNLSIYNQPFTSMGYPLNPSFSNYSLKGFMTELVLLNNKISDSDAITWNNTKLAQFLPTIAAALNTITALSGTSVQVNWGAFGYGTSYIRVSWSPSVGFSNVSANQIISTGSYYLNGLTQLTTYNFTVTPYYLSGLSGISELQGYSLPSVNITTPASNLVVGFASSNISGATGPALASLTNYYTNTLNKNNLTMTTNGIQLWTVQTSGVYNITCAGASGGINGNVYGGRGAIVSGKVALTAGNVIAILIGQIGTGRGGGGGTFIVNNTTSTLLFAAGGGGGPTAATGYDAVFTNSGLAGAGSTGGSAGGGGGANIGAGGGGYSGAGTNGTDTTTTNGGSAYTSGGVGGTGVSGNNGGFGGGGGGGPVGAGGGGGYSGGGGGSSGSGGGGGGGSYITPNAYSTTLINYNNYGSPGYALFDLRGIDVTPATTPITNVTSNSVNVNWGVFNPNVSYIIITWTNGVSTFTSGNISTPNSTYFVSNLVAGQTYTFTITPFDSGNNAGYALTGSKANGTASNPNGNSVTINLIPVISNFAISSTTPTSVSLSWTATNVDYSIITWTTNTNYSSGNVATNSYTSSSGISGNPSITFTITPYTNGGIIGTQQTITVYYDGSTAALAGSSATNIITSYTNKSQVAVDGVYWINLPTVGATQIYCIMNTNVNGGGWMMAMKATTGATFQYSSSHWTTVSTVSPTDTTRNNADAKFDTMNYFVGTDLLALWPDINTTGGSLTTNTTTNPFGCWSWRQIYGAVTPSTMIALFNSANNTSLGAYNAFSGWSATYWSSQAGNNFYGFNFTSSAANSVRWGFGFNNEFDWNSNDVSGGIGMTRVAYSAGDYYNCCGTAGINRSARVEIYVR